ncbi:MAG: protein translocase subunit SecD, partial [Anaerolineae bacterium]
MSNNLRWLIVVIIVTVFSVWVVLPDNPGIHVDTNGDGTNDLNLNVQQSLGLDLVGGLRVLLTAELPEGGFSADDLRQTANNVARRVNALGVTEPTVQVQGSNRILVELPGISNPQEAIDTIQQTALLEFVDFSGMSGQVTDFTGKKILTDYQLENQPGGNADGDHLVNPQTGQPFTTVMTGAGLQSAAAQLQTSGQYVIAFQLTTDGAAVFGPFTAAHIGQPLAIVLDGTVLSAPVINSRLDTGGIIEGRFTQQEAQTLALQLRSGALPIPLRVESAETVGATLGQESVSLSIRAGVIGVIVVLMFMFIYYRVPGIAADLALLVFVVLNLALFKLIPVTLTLPAITGFLISIGTAV